MQNLKNEDDLKILRYTMVCPLNKKSLISELDFRVNIICYLYVVTKIDNSHN